MSRFPSQSVSAPSTKDAGITLAIEDVLASVGFLPSALVGSLSERQFQLVDHHRRKTIKSYTGPGGRRAQKLIALRLSRYGSKPGASVISDLTGESFATRAKEGPLSGRAIERLEEGGNVTTAEPMIVPIGAGAREIRGGVMPTKQFVDAVKGRRFRFVKTARGVLAVVTYAGRGRQLFLGAPTRLTRVGEKSVVLGILSKKRKQRKLLNFFDTFDAVRPKHEAAMAKDLDLAMTSAGRAKLQKRLDGRVAERAAYKAAMAQVLAGDAKAFGPAKKAARAAALAVRAGNKIGGAE